MPSPKRPPEMPWSGVVVGEVLGATGKPAPDALGEEAAIASNNSATQRDMRRLPIMAKCIDRSVRMRACQARRHSKRC